MCGRYYLDEEIRDERLKEQIHEAARVAARIDAPLKTQGEVRPFDVVPVIAPSSLNRRIGAFPMQWGFRHPTKGMAVFNTRSETVLEKQLFVTSVDERRCLLPASCYFEWKKLDQNKKEKYAFYAENGDPLYLAGLYIRTSDEHRLPCFTILTRDADRSIRDLHPRMPVLVPYARAEECGECLYKLLPYDPLTLHELGYTKYMLGKAKEAADLYRRILGGESKLLSNLERQVVQGLAEGRDYRHIAQELGRSPKSIDNAIQRIRKKLQAFFGELG